MNVATNYLREHLHFSARMHYVITEGGEAPDVIPDRASVWYFLRHSDDQLESMYERVLNCAEAMAASAIDLLTQPDALRAIRREFDDYAKQHPYKSFLPAAARPPLELYDKLMGQYRPLMRTFHSEAETSAPAKGRD
jgi:hypothetical protein